MTVGQIPRVHSYGFKEDGRRGLILMSNDPREAHEIIVQFEGKVKDGKARTWSLKSVGLESVNEHDWAPSGPEVTIEEKAIDGFQNGTSLTLDPAGMVAVSWDVE